MAQNIQPNVGDPFLIFEHIANGSLYENLHVKRNKLDYKLVLMKIA